MSGNCAQDILDGFLNRECQYNGEEGVHRGTILGLHADFTAEDLFSEEYTLWQVQQALVEIHQNSQAEGLYINYVGPGSHSVVIPVLDSRGGNAVFKASDLDKIEDSGWVVEGVHGMDVIHKTTGEQFSVSGNADDNNGYVYVVNVLEGCAERRLLTHNGTGLSAIQEYRRYEGDIAWDRYISKLNLGRIGQMYTSADAYKSKAETKADRAKSNRLRREAAFLENVVSMTSTFREERINDMMALRVTIPWLQDLVLDGP